METNGWGYLEGCPANDKESDLTFDSSDLSECLEYGQQTNDFSHLETAIQVHNSKRRYALEHLNVLIAYAQTRDNDLLTNELKTIKKFI